MGFRRNAVVQKLVDDLVKDLPVVCDACTEYAKRTVGNGNQVQYNHAEKHEDWCPHLEVDCPLKWLGCDWTGKKNFFI